MSILGLGPIGLFKHDVFSKYGPATNKPGVQVEPRGNQLHHLLLHNLELKPCRRLKIESKCNNKNSLEIGLKGPDPRLALFFLQDVLFMSHLKMGFSYHPNKGESRIYIELVVMSLYLLHS